MQKQELVDFIIAARNAAMLKIGAAKEAREKLGKSKHDFDNIKEMAKLQANIFRHDVNDGIAAEPQDFVGTLANKIMLSDKKTEKAKSSNDEKALNQQADFRLALTTLAEEMGIGKMVSIKTAELKMQANMGRNT